MSSFEQLFQGLVAKAANGRGGNTFVYVNVNLGQPASSDPLGQVVDMAGSGTVGPAPRKGNDGWNQAEQDEHELKVALAAQAEQDKDKHPEAAPEADTPVESAKKNGFRGTVNQQTLVDKAVALELTEAAAGKRLWDLLMTSKELRNLCGDHQVPFPPLGKNGAFRRTDLRQLAKLEGLTKVPGFGSRSQACKVLKSL